MEKKEAEEEEEEEEEWLAREGWERWCPQEAVRREGEWESGRE